MTQQNNSACNLQLFVNNKAFPIIKIRFPAGESMIRVPARDVLMETLKSATEENPWPKVTTAFNELFFPIIENVTVRMDFRDNGDFIDLMLLMDAVRREYKYNISQTKEELILDYLPYARQDRVNCPGESLSIKVITDIVNSLQFNTVYCKDIHSDVGISLLNNLSHLNTNVCGSKLPEILGRETILVSPDAGAARKVHDFARNNGYRQIVSAYKKRDPETGIISGTWVDISGVTEGQHLGNRDMLIVDDICDGGATFLGLGQKLREITDGKLYLYVTHGIFSKGLDDLLAIYDTIYVSNNMSGLSSMQLIEI